MTSLVDRPGSADRAGSDGPRERRAPTGAPWRRFDLFPQRQCAAQPVASWAIAPVWVSAAWSGARPTSNGEFGPHDDGEGKGRGNAPLFDHSLNAYLLGIGEGRGGAALSDHALTAWELGRRGRGGCSTLGPLSRFPPSGHLRPSHHTRARSHHTHALTPHKRRFPPSGHPHTTPAPLTPHVASGRQRRVVNRVVKGRAEVP